MTDVDRLAIESNSRRAFIGKAAFGGAGIVALGFVSSAKAAILPQQPEAETGHSYTMALPNAMNEAQFRMGVIGPATLSRMTSEIGVDKATNAHAKEFANFELREAIAVTTVLANLKTPVPPMDATAKATLEKIQSAPAGAAFDMAYMNAQLENHEFLRDHTTSYLKNSSGSTTMLEMNGRNLATLALATFTEHVQICKDILADLKA